MTIENFLEQLKRSPESIEFDQVMNLIAEHYDYTPAAFSNGQTRNEAGTNEGSCKIFAFAKLNGLNQEETLACFGKFYREDVLQHPDGDDHANIRQFMLHGWAGVQFESMPIKLSE